MSFSSFLTLVSRSESKEKKRLTRHRSEEDEGMRASFKVFDIDGDGFIDAAELRQTMHDLGESLSDRDVESMIKSADKNGDGRIDYEGRFNAHDVWQFLAFLVWNRLHTAGTCANAALITYLLIEMNFANVANSLLSI